MADIKIKRGSGAALTQTGTPDPTLILEGEPVYDYENHIFKIGHSSDKSPTRFDQLPAIGKPKVGDELPATGTLHDFFYITTTKQLYIYTTEWEPIQPYFDNVTTITLNSNLTGAPVANGGITLNRGTLPDAMLVWDEEDDAWKIGLDGAMFEIISLDNLATEAATLTTLKWGGHALPELVSGRVLSNNGTTLSWEPAAVGLPDQSTSAGKILSTNGTSPSWITPPVGLPTQTDNSGKFVTTNGTAPSWKTLVWDDVTSKPLTFAPATHDNAAHSATYITAAGVTFENLSNNGDIGTGAAQVAAGDHIHALLHDAVTVTGNGITLTGQQIALSIGTGATQIASGNHTHAYLSDAASDGKFYARKDGAWAEVTAGSASFPTQTGNGGKVLGTDGSTVSWVSHLTDAPSDNKTYGRKNAAWVEVTSGSSGDSTPGGIVGYDYVTRALEGIVYETMLTRYIVPADSIIDLVTISLDGLPGGQNFLVDVRKNGILPTDSIFVNDTPMAITPTQTAVNDTYVTVSSTNLDTSRTSLVANDVLYMIITQVGSTYQGSDFIGQIGVKFTNLYTVGSNATTYATVSESVTLPATPVAGETVFEYIGTGTNWVLTAAPGQYIRLLSTESVLAGSIASTSGFDCVSLIYIGSISGHNTWLVKSFAGMPVIT